jgi:hypothetical protein
MNDEMNAASSRKSGSGFEGFSQQRRDPPLV